MPFQWLLGYSSLDQSGGLASDWLISLQHRWNCTQTVNGKKHQLNTEVFPDWFFPPSHPDEDCLPRITSSPLLVYDFLSFRWYRTKGHVHKGEGWSQDWLLNQELCLVAEPPLHSRTSILWSHNCIPVTSGALLLRPTCVPVDPVACVVL